MKKPGEQINQDLRHHLVNGLCGIRTSEINLREGYVYVKEGEGYIKKDTDLMAELENIDIQLKRIFEALRKYEEGGE